MLSLSNLYLQKGSFALQKVSLDVKQREYLVILGRTGSGKTLLLETIAGLQKHAGIISCNGRDITHIPPEKRSIGFVYQDFALFPHLSVIKNIRFSDRYKKNPENSHWDELIEFLDLKKLLHREIHHLSGGEKQRVALARAIHSRPDILLLDEPLSAIDPSFRNSIMENLKGLNHRFNITVIHVTHNFREAAYLADKIGIMMDGKLVQHGPAHDVLHHPSSIAVARFLGFENILPGRLINSEPEGGTISLYPSLINITSDVQEKADHNLSGICVDIQEKRNNYRLVFDVKGSAVFVKTPVQIFNSTHIRIGATLNLSFPHSAVTRFRIPESCDEASV